MPEADFSPDHADPQHGRIEEGDHLNIDTLQWEVEGRCRITAVGGTEVWLVEEDGQSVDSVSKRKLVNALKSKHPSVTRADD